MPELSITDFPAFFDALWRPIGSDQAYTPFPWQTELVAKLDKDRTWPRLIDLPTGSGKTTLLDLAVFMLALDGYRSPTDRWMPRRVALVVDRRVVVDQADERAAHLAERIDGTPDPAGVLGLVRTGLRRLASAHENLRPGQDHLPCLRHAVLRGGMVRDESWARSPEVPALLSSTVDQVGSRLLFRGYGISTGMRPIHAGLLGNDVLYLLDEVHLAVPFSETLDQIGRYKQLKGDGSRSDRPPRWGVVRMSATPSDASAGRASDRWPGSPLEPGSHPVLRRRLTARKPARLAEVTVPKDPAKAAAAFAGACARAALDLVATTPTIAVIVNRVDTARRVTDLLKRSEDIDVVLLTGRMRSLDRDRVLQMVGPRVANGRTRGPLDQKLVLVSTQSIEAGADFDLDAIVTECASLDALRQRFGRVDRDGQLSEKGAQVESSILIRSTDTSLEQSDPVYGSALAKTWAHLASIDGLDFGIQAFSVPADLGELTPPPAVAPILLPGHLDQWVQTSHRPPATDPDVARWLHGVQVSEELADVQVIWRADIDESLLGLALPSSLRDKVELGLTDRLSACPPASGEALGVPVRAFRRWCRGLESAPIADVDGIQLDDSNLGDERRTSSRSVVRWQGGRAEICAGDAVRPGDTVVVPATRGGVTDGNWDPGGTSSVSDLGLEAQALQRHRAVIRFGVDVPLPGVDDPAHPDAIVELLAREQRKVIADYLESITEPDVGLTAAVNQHLTKQPSSLRLRLLPCRLDGEALVHSYVITTNRAFDPSIGADGEGGTGADEDGRDAPSFTGAAHALLHPHLRGVQEIATGFATTLGLPEEVVADIGRAGYLHDAGKVDRRFQAWLTDGRSLPSDAPVAKSATPESDRVARRESRRRSGYPKGGRHELASSSMIEATPASIAGSNDPQLVQHLVASHHGFGRYRFTPYLEPSEEPLELQLDDLALTGSAGAELVRLDRGGSERFWDLVRRYGWFRLSWLEAILRLADHERSRQEEAGEADLADGADATAEEAE